MTIGDGRRYNTALITLDPEGALTWAKRLGLESESIEELVEPTRRWSAAVEDAVDARATSGSPASSR